MLFPFSKPAAFNTFLSENNQIEKIYKAMEDNDYSEVIMAALDILKINDLLPSVERTKKSVNMSMEYITHGNIICRRGCFQDALKLYNKALLFAPKDSKAMKMVYMQRSHLLERCTAFKASLADMCLAMDVTKRKDINRKEMLIKKAAGENLCEVGVRMSANYIDTNISQNSDIPCASDKVKIDKSDIPKMVAATVVNPGSILANEKAFVSYTSESNRYISCYYCQRMALHLIPCDNCCFALFCNEDCKKKCNIQYHDYECQIMDILDLLLFSPSANLMLKASLKLKAMFKSWKKFIKASWNDNIHKNNDFSDRFLMLQPKNEKPFVYGIMYDSSFVCAAVIHYLQELTSFFPENSKPNDAIRAFSRIMLSMVLNETPIPIVQISTDLSNDKTNSFTEPNYGFYAFIGKIKISCTPNTMIVNNNNQLILLSNQTIERGSELTVSYLHETKMANRHEGNINHFWACGSICDCNLCDETSQSPTNSNDKLSLQQKTIFDNIDFQFVHNQLRILEPSKVYWILLKNLDLLKNVRYSYEYQQVLRCFRQCIMYYESTESKNYIL